MKTNILETYVDDLTVIKGIKKVRQAWLREHLKVKTYSDLAALSIEQVALALKEDGRSVARKTIELWIETAADLAKDGLAHKDGATSVSQPEKLPLKEWQPFASFVVEFQECKQAGQLKEQRTTVHYMETDDGKIWPNLAHEALSVWLKERVGETALPQPNPPMLEPIAEPPLAVSEPIQATVIRLIAKQPLQAVEPQLLYEPERPFWGYLQSGQPFSMTIELLLQNVPEEDAAVVAELYARNLSTGTNYPLPLTMELLKSGQGIGTAVLRQGILPEGYYRFGLLLKQTQPRSVQLVELPQLQVA